MTSYLTLDDFNVKDKTVLVRADFNSPVDPESKKVLDGSRIRAHGESTIRELVSKGAKVVVLAHQGRKGDSDFIPLRQHADLLGYVLGKAVKYVEDVYGERAKESIRKLKSGEVLLLENVRTYAGETKDGTPEDHAKTELVGNLAPLFDLFVLDAFAAAHRAQVSIVGFTAVLPSAAGRIMERELKSLGRVLENPAKPSVFVLGGAKADDSLEISKHVLDKGLADCVLVGGVAGQVFLAAKGVNLGKPNVEFLEKRELLAFAGGIGQLLHEYPDRVVTPIDVGVEENGRRVEVAVSKLPTGNSIMDIGGKTIEEYSGIIGRAKTIVVSGPMGVYENAQFSLGTRRVFEAIAGSNAFSLAGGGHTIAALQEFGLFSKISYVSTAGGALIEFLMGKKLPGVVALERAAAREA